MYRGKRLWLATQFYDEMFMDSFSGFDTLFDTHAAFSGAGPASIEHVDMIKPDTREQHSYVASPTQYGQQQQSVPVQYLQQSQAASPAQQMMQQIQQLPVMPQVLPALPAPQLMSVPISKPSFIDRMFMRRKDFSRILVLALLAMLALSIQYLVSGVIDMLRHMRTITLEQDIACRIVYAVLVFLMAWILKTINSDEKALM
jgi:uncharacterized membrane protein (DUF485 family)